MLYKRKTIEKWKSDAWMMSLVIVLVSLMPAGIGKIYSQAHPPVEFIDPRSTAHFVTIIKTVPGENIDGWVDKYTNKYFSGWKVSEVKFIMHCLLHRESGHGAGADKRGDNGAAIGLLQFHYSTFVQYRQLMIDQGYATEIGNIMDFETQIETTIWAIKDGRALAWGPIFRNYNGSDYAACQTPSWY